MKLVTVPVWLLQKQGCISFLNLVGERDQKKHDPLQMEMFWAIKPEKTKSEARAEQKTGHKFLEWIVQWGVFLEFFDKMELQVVWLKCFLIKNSHQEDVIRAEKELMGRN